MKEIYFTDMDVMIKTIMEHTKKHHSYVICNDNVGSIRIGWVCVLTNTFFFMHYSNIATGKNPEASKILKSPVARNSASMYLSNCKTTEEYTTLQNRINKLKAFW